MVMTGKDKGKIALVLRTFPQKNQVLVEGVNQFKKHQKGEAKGRGELVTITKPMNASKVMLVDPESGKPTRVGFLIEDGKKYRIAKKSGTKLVNQVAEISQKNEVEKEPKKKSSKKPKTKSSKEAK